MVPLTRYMPLLAIRNNTASQPFWMTANSSFHTFIKTRGGKKANTVNDGCKVPGESVLVDVLAQEVVLGGHHDLCSSSSIDEAQGIPKINLIHSTPRDTKRHTNPQWNDHRTKESRGGCSVGVQSRQTSAVRMKMTNLGLPSSSILGRGGGGGLWNWRDIIPLFPLASTKKTAAFPLPVLKLEVPRREEKRECLARESSVEVRKPEEKGTRRAAFRDIPTTTPSIVYSTDQREIHS